MPATDAPAELLGAAPGDLELLRSAAEEAGAIAMSFFRNSPDVWYKNAGRSPVSEADMAVNRYLRERLAAARPGYGWLSEESEDSASRLEKDMVFVVDPIDGTRAFLAGEPDWCVSVALAARGRPVAGVLFAPALNERWHGAAGEGAFLDGVPLPFHVEGDVDTPMRIAMPESVADQLFPAASTWIDRRAGGPSLALRLARVAGGRLDATFVRAKASEWDIAAAHVLLCETGHALTDDRGAEVRYNLPDPTCGLLIAAGRTEIGRLVTGLKGGADH